MSSYSWLPSQQVEGQNSSTSSVSAEAESQLFMLTLGLIGIGPLCAPAQDCAPDFPREPSPAAPPAETWAGLHLPAPGSGGSDRPGIWVLP